MKRIFFGLIAVVVIGWNLRATNAAAEISHGVDFPKGDAAWSVKFEGNSSTDASSKTASDDRTIKKTEIVRMGNLRRDTVTWSDGTHSECWWTQEPPFVFQEDVNKRVTVKKIGDMGDQRFDGSIFEWVADKTFVKMQTYEGKKCRFYKTEVPLIENEKQILRAWIDEKTLKPVAWSDGNFVAVFSFDVPLPSEPLVMPAAINKEIDRLRAFFAPARTPVTP